MSLHAQPEFQTLNWLFCRCCCSYYRLRQISKWMHTDCYRKINDKKHGRLCPNLKWRVKGNFKNQNRGGRFRFGSTVNQAQITGGFGLDWLGWSAGKFKTTPTILIFQIFLGKTHSSEVKIVVLTYFLSYSRCEWFDCGWESALSEVGRSLPPSSSSIFEVRPTRPEAMAASSSIGRPVCTTKFFPASFWGCK